jgi:hypothetical protein
LTDIGVNLLLKAQADQALAAVKSAATEVKALGAATRSAATDADRAAAASRNQAAAAQQIRTSHTLAAGSVGNLTAQFNDIGQMLLAGQNPLTLAVQQGTQISQVLGPLGAGGAVRALGSAFMGMINPVSLITIGSIAAGAAMLQWLTGASKDARSFDDNLAALDDSIKALNESANRYSAEGLASIEEKYGTITAEVLRLVEAQRMLDEREALSNLRSTLNSLTNEVGAGLFTFAAGDLSRIFGVTERQALSLYGQMRQIGDLDTFGAQADALSGLANQIEVAAGGVANMSARQFEFYQQIIASEAAVRQLAEAERSAVGPATAALRERLAAERELRASQIEFMVEKAAVQQQDAAWAAQTLADLSAQSNMQATILQYGADSAEVAQARADAERAVFEEMLASRDISEDLKAELLLSFDVMQLMEGANVAGPISNAANEASRLATNLGISVGLAQQIMSIGDVVLDPRDPRYDAGAAQRENQFGFEYGRTSPFAPSPPDRISSSGAGRAPSGAGRSGGGSSRPEPGSLAALQAEAAEALASLDLAVAGIAEKVRAGLLTSAEGADAVDDATRRAAEGIAELIPEIERVGPAGIEVAADLRVSMTGLVADLRVAGSELSESLSGSFEGAFSSFLSGAKSGQDAFGDFADFVKTKIADLLAQRFTSQFVMPLFDSILGAVGLGAAPAVAGVGTARLSSDVLKGPGLSLARGTSGARRGDSEAGAKAAPLGGRPGGDVTVNVINNAQGATAKVTERTEGGRNVIDVMIEQVRNQIAGDIAQGRGPVPDALASTYALSRSPR